MQALAPVPGGNWTRFGQRTWHENPLFLRHYHQLHHDARNPNGPVLQRCSLFAARNTTRYCNATIATEPSYRDPSHSGWAAYAPVDLPTPFRLARDWPSLMDRHDIGHCSFTVQASMHLRLTL